MTRELSYNWSDYVHPAPEAVVGRLLHLSQRLTSHSPRPSPKRPSPKESPCSLASWCMSFIMIPLNGCGPNWPRLCVSALSPWPSSTKLTTKPCACLSARSQRGKGFDSCLAWLVEA